MEVKIGDVLVGRPAAAGCPVSHCGIVVAKPDCFNGLVEWQVVGPMAGREQGKDIGMYTPVAYEGLALFPRTEILFGMRYFFLPRYCMLQARHSGLVNMLSKTPEGIYVRLEGIILASGGALPADPPLPGILAPTFPLRLTPARRRNAIASICNTHRG